MNEAGPIQPGADEAGGTTALGPALFVGLSLFVAMSQSSLPPEMVNPQDTMPAETWADLAGFPPFRVPQILARPGEVTMQTPRGTYTTAAAPMLASAFVPRSQAEARPALAGPALQPAPTPATFDAGAPSHIPSQASAPGAAPLQFLYAGRVAVAPRWSGLRPAMPSPALSAPHRSIPAPARIASSGPPPLRGRVQTVAASSPSAPPRAQGPAPATRLLTQIAEAKPRVALPAPAALHSTEPPRPISALRTIEAPSDPVAFAAPTPEPRLLTRPGVFLRNGPGMRGQTIGVFGTTDDVTLFDTFGRWARVRIIREETAIDGWIWADYLAPLPPAPTRE
ncbi:hypothetical protein [Pseudaestuariivita sp.]|uniref:hypothetical protein n=1 Tax=Pseudaestuariivita sp. TaxID=2211669 RepID=UPI004059DFCE